MTSAQAIEDKAIEMDILKTEEAIFFVKQNFQRHLARELALSRVSCPLFVSQKSGMQDNLNGVEKPVAFQITAMGQEEYQIVQSLAKWKRFALKKYAIQPGKGIYTDMNAIRPDEDDLTTSLHSIYVDQWDWEKVIQKEHRTLDQLKKTVKRIYQALKDTEQEVLIQYGIKPFLPDEITFIHSEELVKQYPDLSAKERENKICEQHKAVFLIGIGGELSDGKIHDGRAPDYDDWTTVNQAGYKGLNGDILLWHPVLKRAFEISSMGIRVDREALKKQIEIRQCPERLSTPWHKMLLDEILPQSIGGGIGQSRICMFFLRKKHIGEVQVSIWPDEIKRECQEQGINLL